MSKRTTSIALGLAGAFAVLMPALALWWPVGKPASDAAPAQITPISVAERPALTAIFGRKLFGSDVADTASSGPDLVGIVGRIDHDAVALIRDASGASRVLRIGESADGWTLSSLAPDAAFFTRGGEQKRVALSFDDESGAAGAE